MHTLPKCGVNYIVYSDASRVSLGCDLTQGCKVIGHVSRQLKIHERSYLTNVLELEDVVFVQNLWRHYFYGVHVDVFIDHKSLQSVFTQRELNLRQQS